VPLVCFLVIAWFGRRVTRNMAMGGA